MIDANGHKETETQYDDGVTAPKLNIESLQAIQEAEEFFASGCKALTITAEGILNRTTISARSSALIPWEAVGGVSNELGGIKIHPSSHADAERYITPRNQAIMTQHLTLPSGMKKRDLIQAIEDYRDSAHGEAKVAAMDTSR